MVTLVAMYAQYALRVAIDTPVGLSRPFAQTQLSLRRLDAIVV